VHYLDVATSTSSMQKLVLRIIQTLDCLCLWSGLSLALQFFYRPATVYLGLSAIKGSVRVSPVAFRGSHTGTGKAVEPTWLPFGVVILKAGVLFDTAFLYPAQPLQIREVGDKRVISAAIGLPGDACHPLFGNPLDVVGAYGPLLPFCLLLFLPGCPIHCRELKAGHLVMVESIGLGSTYARVYRWRPEGRITHKELSDKPAATEWPQEAASSWPKR
jgi:hypothetical protein